MFRQAKHFLESANMILVVKTRFNEQVMLLQYELAGFCKNILPQNSVLLIVEKKQHRGYHGHDIFLLRLRI